MINSVKDLAENLRENQTLDSPVIVYCKGPQSEVQREAERLMRGESQNNISVVEDAKLAE